MLINVMKKTRFLFFIILCCITFFTLDPHFIRAQTQLVNHTTHATNDTTKTGISKNKSNLTATHPKSSFDPVAPVQTKSKFWNYTLIASAIGFGVGISTMLGAGVWSYNNIEYDCRSYRGFTSKYDEYKCQSKPKDFIKYHSEQARELSVNVIITGAILSVVSLSTGLMATVKVGRSRANQKSCKRKRCLVEKNQRSKIEDVLPQVSLTLNSSELYLSNTWSF